MSSWDQSPWDFSAPKVHAPSPKTKAPKPFPEPDRLFQVQRNALKVLNDVQEIERHLDKTPHAAVRASAVLRRLQQDAENTYRVIRSYLDKYANAQGEL